jgi:serine protease Do
MRKPVHQSSISKLLFIVAIVTLSGCAHLFSSRYQKVTINSATPGTKVIYPTEGIVTKKGSVRFDKMRMYHTVTIEKEGYKSANYSFQIGKRSPTFAFAILDILVPFYGWFYGIPIDLVSPKTRKFQGKQTAPALVSYDKRKSDEKFLIIDKTAIDTKGSDFIWHEYLSMSGYKNGSKSDTRSVRKHNKAGDRDDIKIDNTVFTTALNKSMKKMNFIDTANTIFPAAGNTLYLNATVKKITIHDLESRIGRRSTSRSLTQIPNELLSIELEIEWEVLDYYKQKIYTTTTNQKSDLFTYSYKSQKNNFNNFIIGSMENDLEYSMLKIRKELADKGFLKVSGKKENTLTALSIPRPQKAENSRMNDYMKSVVIVKVGDGHGSGSVLSADGYILTSYHVVAGTKKIEAIFYDGTKVDAVLVRKNEEADLALLKVDRKDLTPLLLGNIADPEIGIDVWAIGTPEDITLGQSVSKGVLSGLRKANNLSYLQTDVSINHGNSGGPLINKEGTILGVVTSKLIGVGTEGVGFAINATEVFDKLKIEYH